ncbi:hypothetical protein BF93_01665 [Brachybacterium phenoliresistens]|uniref:Uncharacterized protein n=1 Tax=Brachybacterium phenoliresistens TaxID=396014 RepID=Z9JRZ3_9MICO|nr:hypothetical protein [Brachybacterium phenoliresistens]EWS80813.1 hypothetical protein BF93_01665 [Brachybacterium phenoliresistens]
MRIYLPVTPAEHAALRSGAGALELPAGRSAWAVHASARTDRPGEDPEDLEYDALQDAVHVALTSGPQEDPDRRALVVAGDVPDRAVVESPEEGGAYGIELPAPATLRIAAFHVSELGARAVEADDTDPALLWFDASEGAAALDYAEAPSR